MDKWKNNDDYYQEEEYKEEEYKENNSFDNDPNENLDEDDPEDEGRLITKLDDELLEYFSEARVITKKSLNKKKKKEKIIYSIGDTIKANNHKGSIIYGPYDLNGKQMYEVEIEGNGIISVEEKNIKKI